MRAILPHYQHNTTKETENGQANASDNKRIPQK